MKSGKLRHLVTVERFTDTVDEFGTPIKTWAPLTFNLRAEVKQQSTEEFIRSQGATDERLVIFITRYVSDVTTADRIMWRGTPHNIKEIAVIGHERGMEIRTVTVE